MGSSLNWLQFWWAAKCILYSFKKKTRKKKKKIWRNKWRYCMTSKRSNTWSKTFEQEQHKLILRTDGRFNLLWCDTVFDFFFPLSFFFQFDCLFLLEDSKVRTKWKQLRWHQHYMYCEILQAELSLPFSVDDEKADDNFVCSCFPMCGR